MKKKEKENNIESDIEFEPIPSENKIPPELQQAGLDLSNQMILQDLIDGSKNLSLKTRIEKPKEFTLLELYGYKAEVDGYKNLSKFVNKYVRIFRENMVSFKGLSRKETITALAHLIESERENMSLSKRLRTNIRKE